MPRFNLFNEIPGVQIVEPPTDRPWGLYEMRVTDLDGNIIRIASNREEPGAG